MHHVKEHAQEPRRPLRFEEEPCSWTGHVAVRDSIKRELMYIPPAPRTQSRSTCTHQSWVVSKVVGHALSDSGPMGTWFYAPEVEINKVHDSTVSYGH